MGTTTIVREHEHITVNDDDTRILNFDELFKNDLDSYPESIIDGKPSHTIFVKFGSLLKLVDSRGNYFSPGGWDENHYNRKEFGGPMVKGPEMFCTLHGTVITAHPDNRQEIAYEINEGDTVIFFGAKFKVSRDRLSNRLNFTKI